MAQKQPIILKNEPLAVISLTTMAQISEPLATLVADVVAFAVGRLSRSELEASLQFTILAIYEMQEDCPTCRGTGRFLPDDPRNLWRCPDCNGRRWRWKRGG
jgi:hypothetical protein